MPTPQQDQLQRILLSKMINDEGAISPAVLDLASKGAGTQQPMPTYPGAPGMPPSPEAASIMQTWFPKGLTQGARINQAPSLMYGGLKGQAEQAAAIQQLNELLGKK